MANVSDESSNNKINIVTNVENNVTVTQPNIQTVTIKTGPIGPAGPAGAQGPSGSSSTVDLSGLNAFTGSAQTSIDALNTFTGSGAFNNITASGDISASGTIITENGNVKNNLTVGGNLDIADTIYHTGDSNTKIRFPAVDTISLHTSGDERLRISPDGNISSSNNLTINNITSSGDILLDEDQRIFFEADKNTYIESHASDTFRAVVNARQMFLLDEDTGNRAVFGNGTKVYIGNNNNHQPTNQLEVSGSISVFGGGTPIGGHITASGDISSSGMVKAFTGSFGRLEGLSPITVGDSITFEQPITGSIFSGSFVGDVTSALPNGVLSGSSQIATEISGSFTSTSSSLASRIATVEDHEHSTFALKTAVSGAFAAPSASFSTRTTALEANPVFSASSISGSSNALSASFSTRVTTNTTNITSLTAATSSYLTSLPTGILSGSAQIASNISGSFTATSSSLASRTSTLEGAGYITSAFPFTGDAQITGSLTISGSFNAFTLDSDNIVLGKGAGADMLAGANNNTIIGPNAGANLTTGDNNVFLGQNAGAGITTYHYNTAIGYYAMGSTSDASTYNVAVGYTALRYGSGVQGNIGIGYQALQGVGGMNGDYNIGIGYGAGDVIRDGLNNVFVGKHAGGSINDGDSNIAIGITAGNKITDGNDNICIGNLAGRNLVTGTGNIILGTSASLASDLDGMLVIGSGSLATISASLATGNIILQGDVSSSSTSTASFGTYLGDGSQLSNISTTPFPFTGDAVITGSLTISGSLHAFTLDSDNIVLGSGSGVSMQAGADKNVILGVEAGKSLTTGDSNVLIGYNVGGTLDTETNNVMIGKSIGANGDGGTNNVYVGVEVGRYSSGASYNVGVGFHALRGGASNTGDYNTAIGWNAGYSIDNGTMNCFMGYQSGYSVTTGKNNVILGRSSGRGLQTGDDNILIGPYAGFNITTGASNIIIGSGSVAETSTTNQLRIGNGNSLTTISASLETGDIHFKSTKAETLSIFRQEGSPPPGNGTTHSIAVTVADVNGDNKYLLDGVVTASLVMNQGDAYKFDQADSSNAAGGGHPFRFSTDTGGSSNYDVGVTVDGTPGDAGAFVQISVTETTTAPLYYYCTNHSNMGLGGILSIDSGSLQSTGFAKITGSLIVSSSNVDFLQSTGVSGSFSGSFAGDGSGLTGIDASNVIGNFTSAGISGSFAAPSASFSTRVTTLEASGGGSSGTSTMIASGSTSASADPDTGIVVNHSGSTAFSVIGDVGTLFSVDDSLTGTLFSVNDISGFPVLQAESTGEVYLGKSPQSLYTTAVVSSTNANESHSLCTLSTSSYDGGFFEYTAHSASNARAGNIMSTWNGSNIVYAETTTMDIGDTSDLTTEVIISGSTARLVAYGPNASYKIKTIIKAI